MRIRVFFKVRSSEDRDLYFIGGSLDGAAAAARELAGHWGITVGDVEEVTLTEIVRRAEESPPDDPEILKNVLFDYDGDGMFLFSRPIDPQ